MSTLQQDAEALTTLRQERDAAVKRGKELDRRYKVEQYKLFERMEVERTPRLQVGDVLYSRGETVRGQVQDTSAFLKWCLDNNRPDLFSEKPEKARINELVRDYLRDEMPLPPGLGMYVDQYVSQRGGSVEED